MLNDRTELLLKSLIQRYISEGQPVGSRTLAKEAGLDISPATVRNVMSDLEEMGFISSPHTSAGRVPTQQGYRFFVDSLLKIKNLTPSVLDEIEDRLGGEDDPQQLLATASDLLSRITSFAGVVLVPRYRQRGFKQIEFLQLSKTRVLTILVTDNGQVQNRVINVDRVYSQSELVEASNFFNARFSGDQLSHVRRKLLLEMKKDSSELERLMKTVVKMTQGVFTEDVTEKDDVVLSGEMNLLSVPELCELDKLRQLFDAFKTKHDLLGLLDRSMKANGVHIFIGSESGYEALDGCSVVTAPYEVDGRSIGTLGVIGPTRMAYENVIPIVDVTAKLLGSALSESVEIGD